MNSDEYDIIGVVDSCSGQRVSGWVKAKASIIPAVELCIDGERQPLTLEPVLGHENRYRFRAVLPTKCSVAELVNEGVRIEASFGKTSVVLKCWKPLIAAALVEGMTQPMIKRLLSSLGAETRQLLELAINPESGTTDDDAGKRRQRRALFGNASFRVIAGSELVILEAAEHLLRLGWACDVTAWDIGEPMLSLARAAGINLLSKPEEVRPLTYDLVWLQNRLEAVLDFSPGPTHAPRTLFAFAHLDRSWAYAQPGVVVENLLGQLFVVTSERARDRVIAGGLQPGAVRMFRNAAPPAFAMAPPVIPASPARLLLVSNHPPEEVLEAASLLRQRDVDVEEFGSKSEKGARRLMPADIASADALITVGKTVSYALRARRPVYVYDHFGGPGWLRDDNFHIVASRNFSGMCCERRVSAQQIVEEVLVEFQAAAIEAASRTHAVLQPFELERFMEDVIALCDTAPSPDGHRARLAINTTAIAAEKNLALSAGHYFRATMRARHQKV